MNVDHGYIDIPYSNIPTLDDSLPNDYFYSNEYDYRTIHEVQLLLILSDSQISYSFSGLRKRTSLHQHKLTKAIKRLQDRNFLTKKENGSYELSDTGGSYTRKLLQDLVTKNAVNSMKTPDRGWVTSLMRRMGVLLNGWNIYQWDNSFVGMMSTLYYPELATGNIEALCAELTNRGFIPNQAHPRGRAEGITQNPVTSYCALRVNTILGASMAKCIPTLEVNNDWWIQNRDPNGFHLLSYGSELKRRCTGALRQTALYECWRPLAQALGQNSHKATLTRHAWHYKIPCGQRLANSV